MRACLICLPVLLAGCADQAKVARFTPQKQPAPIAVIPERTATRLVETRYELREYHDAYDPTVRHERHAIYRATRVPVRPESKSDSLVIVPRTSFEPASYSPLPRSTEVNAELATQRQITAELRTIQTAMTATQRDAEKKYNELVNQTAETIRLRSELDAERARVNRLEASLREHSATTALPATPGGSADMKW